MDGSVINEVPHKVTQEEIMLTNGVQAAEQTSHQTEDTDKNDVDQTQTQEYDLWKLNYEKLVKLLVIVSEYIKIHHRLIQNGQGFRLPDN